MPLVTVRGLTRTFAPVTILRDLDLDLEPGEVLAIRGASGTGKSTLLNLIGLLDRPDAGSIRLADEEMTTCSLARLAERRAQDLGFVFQGFHLLTDFTAAENVLMPARCAGRALGPARSRVDLLLQAVGLADRASAHVQVLSGGERQRLAICRALLLKPRLLLADEPTGNLDPATAQTVLSLMLDLARAEGSAVVLVTHDPLVAAQAHRQLELRDGRLHAGSP